MLSLSSTEKPTIAGLSTVEYVPTDWCTHGSALRAYRSAVLRVIAVRILGAFVLFAVQ